MACEIVQATWLVVVDFQRDPTSLNHICAAAVATTVDDEIGKHGLVARPESTNRRNCGLVLALRHEAADVNAVPGLDRGLLPDRLAQHRLEHRAPCQQGDGVLESLAEVEFGFADAVVEHRGQDIGHRSPTDSTDPCPEDVSVVSLRYTAPVPAGEVLVGRSGRRFLVGVDQQDMVTVASEHQRRDLTDHS